MLCIGSVYSDWQWYLKFFCIPFIASRCLTLKRSFRLILYLKPSSGLAIWRIWSFLFMKYLLLA